MSILGFKTPEFVVLHLNADQRSQYERFCNDLLRRVWKANDYLLPATPEQIDWWKPFKEDRTPNETEKADPPSEEAQ